MRLGDLGAEWEKEKKDETMAFLVKAQVYSTCGVLRENDVTKFVFNKRKMKESREQIKEFDG